MNIQLHSLPPVVIVGAGLSGLTCAVRLHEAGVPVKLVEASDGVGGRVRTDQINGFLLDRGFQVYLSAYPQAAELLDLDDLGLRAFEPGALVFDGVNINRVMDVFRRPKYLLGSALSSIGNLSDKIRVALLRFQTLGSSEEDIGSHKDQSTESFLKEFGFSKKMIDGFFRSFYGGIFLERSLQTSSKMFEFTFKMFSEGSATLPRYGMGSITQQLVERIPSEAILLNAPVTNVSSRSVRLIDGRILEGSHIVIATHAAQTADLVPGFRAQAPEWRSVTNVYYAAEKSPLNEAIIALNGSGRGLVNNVCVPSDVSPYYAPSGQSLISASLLGIHRDGDLPQKVKNELAAWFGQDVHAWKHLRTDVIKYALPAQPPQNHQPDVGRESEGVMEIDGMYVCGDHTTSSSIEGAIISGNKTAAAILASESRR